METLERSASRDTMTDDVPFDPAPSTPKRSLLPKLWRRVCAFLGVAAIAMTVGSLSSLKDQLASDWQTSLGHFKWIVLVSGDTVEVDEVGRYLKQLDGVGPVTLLPPTAILDQIKSEPLLADQISVLDTASLPSVWSVSWTADFDAAKLTDNLQELRRYPGVVDVAFDNRELDKAAAYRLLWLKVRVLISALLVIVVALFSILLGRFLFFTDLRVVNAGPLAAFVGGTVLAWAAGLGLAARFVGPFTPHLMWGALVAAVARLAWGRVRSLE